MATREQAAVGEDAPSQPASIGRPSERHSKFGYNVLLQRFGVLLALAVLVIVFSAVRPDSFFTIATLTSVLGIQAPLVFLALGVTVVLLVGEFDLSVAATMGFSASLLASLTSVHGMSVPAALIIVLLISLLIGLVNSFFVVRVGIHSFIVTLGMGTVLGGAALGAAGASTIGNIPESFTGVFQARVLGIESAFFYTIAFAVILFIILQRMPLGRHLFFTGEARSAAALAGIRVRLMRTGALTGSSLFAGLAGVLLLGQIGAASPSVAGPYMLPAYAAAFLGATAFTVGRFNVWGTVSAVYLLAVGTVGFQLMGFPSWATDVFNGGILILAVAFSLAFSRAQRR